MRHSGWDGFSVSRHLDDNLSDMLAFLHESEGVRNLLDWERVDWSDRLQLLLHAQAGELVQQPACSRWLAVAHPPKPIDACQHEFLPEQILGHLRPKSSKIDSVEGSVTSKQV